MKKAYRVKILLFLILETNIFTLLLRHSIYWRIDIYIDIDIDIENIPL